MKRWREGGKAAFGLGFWIAMFAVIFLTLPPAGAIQPPTVTFIPDKISANSSFLMIADPHPSPDEPSVTVQFIVFGTNGYGLIPKVSNKYVCYFSNTDPQSNCGMNFFPAPSYGVPYELEVNATTSHTESTMLNVTVGSIPITTETSITGNSVYIKAWAGGSITGTISYKVYTVATLDLVKTGTLNQDDRIFGYSNNITLEYGEYYIAFTANSSTDFAGGVARIVVGGTTPGQTGNVQYDNIIYSPVINPGQTFKIETFKITNIGTENLTALSISVAPEIAAYLTITPKKTSLEPNESIYMSVELQNIHASMNISTFANLKSGSTQLAQIPVNLMVSVIGSQNYSSCVGKSDKTLCLGGICCTEICRTGGADCCSSSDCSSGEECSSSFKCVPSVVPGECEGKNDSETCSVGVCCSQECVECCSDLDCSTGETCTYNTCSVTTNECAGKADKASCTGGICCDEYCINGGECCTNSDCQAGKTCSSNSCVSGGGGGGGEIDFVTIGLIVGGVAAAGIAGFFLFKKFRKKAGKGDEEIESEEEGEEEFSDEDFY